MKPLYESTSKPSRRRRLTEKQVLDMLRDIRDYSLTTWHGLVETQTGTGSAAAAENYRRSAEELYKMEDRVANKSSNVLSSGKIEISFQKSEEIKEAEETEVAEEKDPNGSLN